MATFVVAELVLGGLVGEYVVGRYMSISLRFMLQGALHLASFFVGGIVIGILSPGVRLLEPAVGAALSITLMFSLTLFTPYTFMAMQSGKLVFGGLIAFVIALSGAKLGERLTGNLI